MSQESITSKNLMTLDLKPKSNGVVVMMLKLEFHSLMPSIGISKIKL